MSTLFKIFVALTVLTLAACKTGGRAAPDKRAVSPGQTPVVASGGINDGNTGEFLTTKENPWFVGAAPATYCVEFGDGAAASADPAAQTAIITQVDAAFARWTELFQIFSPQSGGASQAPKGEFLAGKAVANLTRDFRRVDCAQDPEMRIKVGTWDKVDTGFLKYTSRNTVAYALRTKYSEETGRSRGFLWLVADSGPRRYQGPAPGGAFWSQGQYVQNVVLHELGHVMGIEHWPNTFMDASFPAGVLAAKVATAWPANDFKAQAGLVAERCGSVEHLTDDHDIDVLKEAFGIDPAAVHDICWRNANDRKRADDANTPMLVWFKDASGKTLAEQLAYFDGEYGETKAIGGNYLKKSAGGDYRYSYVTHLYYGEFSLSRMHFVRDGRAYCLEAEMLRPGAVAWRFAHEDKWRTVAAWVLPRAEYILLRDLLKAARFEEDTALDD